MNITITDVVPFRLIGVYDNGGVWTQASGVNLAEALAVLDEIPTATGIWTGTIYADGETLYAPDTTSDLEVEYFAYLDGETTATLETISDATVEILMTMTGETLIQNNHGRSFERRLPTGLAWHGEKNKAMLKGLGYEFRRKEIEIADQASINNMLFGKNLANWQKTLRLTATGTITDQQNAIIRKLSDIGGLAASDLTRELHNAGFTDLYAYANKFKVDVLPLTAGTYTTAGVWTISSKKKRFASIDPRQYENYLPGLTAGPKTTAGNWTLAQGALTLPNLKAGIWTTAGLKTTASVYKIPAKIVSNKSENEFNEWNNIPSDQDLWKNYIFICGDSFLKTVRIDKSREKELRKLILTIKPFKTVALMSVYFN